MAGYVPFDPKKPLQPPPAPAATGGYVPFDPNSQPAAPAKPAITSGGGYVPFNPNGQQAADSGAPAGPGWGVDWSKPGGEVTMPQSVQDFGDVAGAEAWMGLPGLRMQTVAGARQRLGPIASSFADVAGNILSPTTLANAIPFVGPEVAGGLHQGIKSYAAGNDWKTIGEDTLGGVGAGLAGHGAGYLAPKVLPRLTEESVKAGFGYAAHKALGGWADAALPEGLGTILPFMTGYGLTQKLGGLAGEGVRKVADLPATKQAIQNLILGGGSALRTAGGPWDQWIPGQ